jgi:hypothetical protein
MSEHFVHEPDLHAHPKKPALKMNSKYSKKKVTLTWDEHAIEEHDQLRGTRMKVSNSSRRRRIHVIVNSQTLFPWIVQTLMNPCFFSWTFLSPYPYFLLD